MQVYRVAIDLNRYCEYWDPNLKDPKKLTTAFSEGCSLIRAWRIPKRLVTMSGIKGDFVGSPAWYARIAANGRAIDVLRPFLEGVCELLRFEARKVPYWCLYIPFPSNCLDENQTIYYTSSRFGIQRAAFRKHDLPEAHIFRIPRSFDYFVTDTFKRAVEDAGLTGLKFEFMWSDTPGDAPEPSRVVTPREPIMERGRRTKRDDVMELLWTEIIHRRATNEWFNEEVELVGKGYSTHVPWLEESEFVLKKALDKGMTAEEVRQLARGWAYDVVFETLSLLDEVGALRNPTYAGLQDDLLIADPLRPYLN